MSPTLFDRESIERATSPQDIGRLKEMDSHDLLQNDEKPVATFDQVLALGEILLKQRYAKRPLASTESAQSLITSDLLALGSRFAGKVRFQQGGTFPVTAECIQTHLGPDFRFHIVPVELSVFETGEYSHRSEALIALAAAAVSAPEFLSALQEGLEEEDCESPQLSVVQPEHGTPMAVVFDSFQPGANNLQTLQQVQRITKSAQPSLAQAAHIHGQRPHSSRQLLAAAGKSTVAGGLTISSLMRRDLPRHVLYFPVKTDLEGKTSIATLRDSLMETGLQGMDPAFIAAALGMTSQVVGDNLREKTIASVYESEESQMPLENIILRVK